MLSLVRNLPRQLNLVNLSIVNAIAKRTYFAPEAIGIDKFVKHCEFMKRSQGSNLSSIRLTVEENMNKENGKIFTEDLKLMLYLTQSDSDLDFLINAIKKYQAQEALAIFNFKFEAPLMRLLYVLNKTDKALELYLADKGVMNDSNTVATLLANKLLEEKRYDDVIKVYNKAAKTIKTTESNKISELYLDALVEKNNAEALKKAKEFLEKLNPQNNYYDKYVKKVFLLAFSQNDTSYAYELISKMKNTALVITQNYKIMTMAKLNRAEEALKLAETIRVGPNKSRIFFRETFNELKALQEKTTSEELKARLTTLIDNSSDKLFERDLKSSIIKMTGSRPRHNNELNNSNQNRNFNENGQMRNMRGDSQQRGNDSGFSYRQNNQGRLNFRENNTRERFDNNDGSERNYNRNFNRDNNSNNKFMNNRNNDFNNRGPNRNFNNNNRFNQNQEDGNDNFENRRRNLSRN